MKNKLMGLRPETRTLSYKRKVCSHEDSTGVIKRRKLKERIQCLKEKRPKCKDLKNTTQKSKA
jgi:hypothetical protein